MMVHTFVPRSFPIKAISFFSLVLVQIGYGQPEGRYGGGAGSGYAMTQGQVSSTVIGRYAGGVGSGNASAGFTNQNISISRFLGGIGSGYASSSIEGANSLLPVEFGEFSAQVYDHTVLLNWNTVSEDDNDYFLVQRSKDGAVYENLGKIPGYGTTNQPKDYSFIDSSPLAGPNYYRLKQVDYDGKYEYSPKVFALFKSPLVYAVFPNPLVSGNYLTVLHNWESDISLGLYDLLGREIKITRQNIESNTYISLSVTAPPGVYTLYITSSNERKMEKIIIE